MDEQILQGFDKNPFAGILQGLPQSAQGQPQPQQPNSRWNMPMQMEQEDNQLMKGKNPDNTNNLVGAIKSIQNYIAGSVDPGEIAIARSIVRLLTKLIDKDQEGMSGKLEQDAQMA